MVVRVIGGGGLLPIPYVGRSTVLESDFSGKWEFHVEAEPHYHAQDQKSQQYHQIQPHAAPSKYYSFITNNKWNFKSFSTSCYLSFDNNICNFSSLVHSRIKSPHFICSLRSSSKSLCHSLNPDELIISNTNRTRNGCNTRPAKSVGADDEERGVFLERANYRNNNGLIRNGVAPEDALRYSFMWQ